MGQSPHTVNLDALIATATILLECQQTQTTLPRRYKTIAVEKI